MSFFPVNNNTLVNIDKLDSVEQKVIEGKAYIIATVGQKEFIVRDNIDQFLTLVKNTGKNETFWSGV